MATLRANNWCDAVFHDESRYAVLYGGAGSGKSVCAAQKAILRSVTEKKQRGLVVRQTFNSIRNSTFHLLRSVVSDLGLQDHFTVNKSELSLRCKLTDSEIISVGLDDVERVKSISNIGWLWIEEASEVKEEDFDQLDLRLRGETVGYKQIMLTFNPISKQHWLKRRFVDGPPESCSVLKTTYRDNDFIDADYARVLETLRDKNPEYYAVYALGEWGEAVEGFIFKRDNYREYDVLPDDSRGVIYCDPNLAKRAKGDNTAITRLLFSPTTAKFYVTGAVCESFDDSNTLLNTTLQMKDERVKAIGFDGNVNQESSWTNNVRQWCRQHKRPFPVIEYKRYRVDELAKNAAYAYSDGQILFAPNFRSTAQGEKFMAQVFSFSGKRAKMADDAPDSLVCAFEFIQERGLSNPSFSNDLAIPHQDFSTINW
jgi:hypothetical protein